MPADPCFSRFRSEPFASPIVIVIAPLTRMCAVRPGDAPQPLNAEYYSQRTSEGGLRRLPIYLTRGRLSRRARQSTRWGGQIRGLAGCDPGSSRQRRIYFRPALVYWLNLAFVHAAQRSRAGRTLQHRGAW